MNTGKHLFPDIDKAYAFYNEKIFNNELLSSILFNIVRRKKAKGYFRPNSLINTETNEIIHEIALMPDFFGAQSDEQTLSTLVHEMFHLKVQIEGKKVKSVHCRRWVQLMETVGLIPFNTKNPQYQCGHSVSHKVEDGKFREVTKELLDNGFKITWVTPISIEDSSVSVARSSRIRTRKYICPMCGIDVRGAYDLKIKCSSCDVLMD